MSADTTDPFLRKMAARIGKENRRMVENLQAWAEVLGALGWKVAMTVPGRSPILNAQAEQWAAGVTSSPMSWEEIEERLEKEQPSRVMVRTPRLQVWTDAMEGSVTPVPSQPLTKRESEVLRWLREGKTGPEIVIILGCRQRTVETHVAKIYRKLGVRRRSELIFEKGAEAS